MSYIFESKSDLLYHENYIALRKAIERAGGDGDYVIETCGKDLLDTLARNQIELSANYIGNRTETK